MNKQIRNKYIVLLTGLIIAVVSTIMSPVSANNNSLQLNTDCMSYVNGIAVQINCPKQPVKELPQVKHSEQKDHC